VVTRAPGDFVNKDRKLDAYRYLQNAQNSDGAWPYVPSKPGAAEPTCYAAMAVAAVSGSSANRALDWLVAREKSDWADSLALLTMIRMNAAPEVRAKTAERLLSFRVRQMEATGVSELDGKLKGWAWVDNTFSWVEPTSYALLALKAAGVRGHPRMAEAERMLLDRMCKDGGWNYGNRNVLGADLPSMPPTTALAAMALQDSPSSDKLRPALDLLEREVLAYPSALSLALTILCFTIFGRPVERMTEALNARQEPDGSWRRQVHLTAMALLALQTSEGGPNVFKLA
jgi:hypothetical protein